MPSELDRKYDAAVAAVTGEGGRIQVGRDPGTGLAIVTNLPPTLPTLFDIFCGLHGDMEAVIDDDERLSFTQLNAHATALARALVARGIGKGDRVGIAMRNCPAWIVCWMAVLKAGGVATLLNGWWRGEEMKHAIALASPSLIIADPPRGERLQAHCTVPLVILPIEQPIAAAIAPLTEGAGEADLPIVLPGDDATILFTSGSTGPAKGAVSTHRAVTTAVYAYAIGLAALLGIKEASGESLAPPRILVNVPLFHVTGEVPVLLNSFVVGRTMVLMRKWDPDEALRLIEKERITYFVGVPTMSMELAESPNRDKYDLSTLTDIAAGGAPRPVSHVKRLQQSFTGAQPALGYGLTETNAVGCSNFWSNYRDKPASTGRAMLPLVEVAILGDDDRHLPPGAQGEIAIRSAANIRGYWNDEAATRALVTADGYVRSGDVGYLDEDGYLFIIDRKKDIIIRGGENISAAEVEAAIYDNPAVAEVAVFGIPDERLGEVPAAIIYSEKGGIDEAGLLAFLAEKLAPFKLPALVRFSDEPLPKLGTGKIDKMTLRQRFRAAAGAATG